MDLTHQRIGTLNFWAGFITSIACLMLWQDYCGLDGYIARLRESWIEPVYTIPIAILVLACALFVKLVMFGIATRLDRDKGGTP